MLHTWVKSFIFLLGGLKRQTHISAHELGSPIKGFLLFFNFFFEAYQVANIYVKLDEPKFHQIKKFVWIKMFNKLRYWPHGTIMLFVASLKVYA
jgi:hypothetical protein